MFAFTIRHETITNKDHGSPNRGQKTPNLGRTTTERNATKNTENFYHFTGPVLLLVLYFIFIGGAKMPVKIYKIYLYQNDGISIYNILTGKYD